MPGTRPSSRGIINVSILALHNRAFFQRLLAEPRNALNAKVRARLGVTPTDLNKIAGWVEAARATMSDADLVVAWDSWQTTGILPPGPPWPIET